MSRSTDLILIRGEVAQLGYDEQAALLAAARTTDPEDLVRTIQQFREISHKLRDEHIGAGICPCEMCRFGRHMAAVGLL